MTQELQGTLLQKGAGIFALVELLDTLKRGAVAASLRPQSLARPRPQRVQYAIKENVLRTMLYNRENGNTEEMIYVDDDGAVIHRIENAGWKMVRKGINERETRYTADEAKEKWPEYATKIDEATARASK